MDTKQFGRAGVVAIAVILAVELWAQEASRLAPDEVIARMETRNDERQERLRSYISERRYAAENPRLHKKGEMLVELRYDSPASKSYRVLEKSGSGSVHSRVFKPLLETEVQQADPQAREATDISRRNYEFRYSHFDEQADAYVFEAVPRTQNKYLFRGLMWVNAKDFAVQKIDAEPAQRPSFWTRKTHFVRDYANYGDFWFPVRHRTEVELRLFGRSTMEIEYSHYSWQPAPPETTSVPK